ncbi:MAG TPA: hypothetical protein VLY82_02700 [Nitrososphaerales archaeon]|nr:hypothetical protein [Nitrososphaerales archaeon]
MQIWEVPYVYFCYAHGWLWVKSQEKKRADIALMNDDGEGLDKAISDFCRSIEPEPTLAERLWGYARKLWPL